MEAEIEKKVVFLEQEIIKLSDMMKRIINNQNKMLEKKVNPNNELDARLQDIDNQLKQFYVIMDIIMKYFRRLEQITNEVITTPEKEGKQP